MLSFETKHSAHISCIIQQIKYLQTTHGCHDKKNTRTDDELRWSQMYSVIGTTISRPSQPVQTSQPRLTINLLTTSEKLSTKNAINFAWRRVYFCLMHILSYFSNYVWIAHSDFMQLKEFLEPWKCHLPTLPHSSK